jgi:hypothetical protein
MSTMCHLAEQYCKRPVVLTTSLTHHHPQDLDSWQEQLQGVGQWSGKVVLYPAEDNCFQGLCRQVRRYSK